MHIVVVRIVRLICDAPQRQDRKVVDGSNLGDSETHVFRFGLVSLGV